MNLSALNLSARNPSTRLKLGATGFSVFWTLGMVLWDRTFDRAHITTTAIAGALLGFGWYFAMRWWLSRKQIPARSRISDDSEAKS